MLDATTGQNAISQAEEFCRRRCHRYRAAQAGRHPRGGCAVSVWENLGLPIRFIGVGEKIDDLMEFDAQTFVETLLPEEALQKEERRKRGNFRGGTGMIVCAASNNAGKLKELRRILEQMGHEVKSLRDLCIDPRPRGDRHYLCRECPHQGRSVLQGQWSAHRGG